MADRARLTVRTLQRGFAEYVGAGPKWVIQRCRLQDAAARAATAEPVDWASARRRARLRRPGPPHPGVHRDHRRATRGLHPAGAARLSSPPSDASACRMRFEHLFGKLSTGAASRYPQWIAATGRLSVVVLRVTAQTQNSCPPWAHQKRPDGRGKGSRWPRQTARKALDSALAQIDKQYGKGSVMRLGDEVRVPLEVIPTGSIALDLALGIGGLPRGRVVEIYGPESSGKTTVALHAIANAQAGGGICAFIDAEHALDPEYAARLGVDTDNLLVSQPDNGEQALEIADMLVRSGALPLIVIDSVAASPREPRSRGRWVTATSVCRPG